MRLGRCAAFGAGCVELGIEDRRGGFERIVHRLVARCCIALDDAAGEERLLGCLRRHAPQGQLVTAARQAKPPSVVERYGRVAHVEAVSAGGRPTLANRSRRWKSMSNGLPHASQRSTQSIRSPNSAT